jgi:hypothetical protein
MVCLAVWMSYSGHTLTDKIMAMLLPIGMFVASGFEHSIANMFLIPLSIVIRYFAPEGFWTSIHASPENFPALTVSNFITANLIPVTIGNIIGGGLLVGITYWIIYLRNQNNATNRVPDGAALIRATIGSPAKHRASGEDITSDVMVVNHHGIWPCVNHRLHQRRQRDGEEHPQNPHRPPKMITDRIMTNGCRLTASENSNGTSRLPSSPWIIR